MEVTAFMNKRSGRCRWQRTNDVISEVFEGTKSYKDMEVAVEGVTVKWPTMVGPEGTQPTGERRRLASCKSPERVEKPKYGKVGGFETRMVRRLSLPGDLERIAVDMCNASLARNTWRKIGDCIERTDIELTLYRESQDCTKRAGIVQREL